MSKQTKIPDVLTLYRSYEPMPKSMDPAKASSSALKKHGFPRKPDREKEPELFKHWEKFLAKKPKYIKAKLSIDKVLSKRNPLRKREDFGPSGWAGIVVETSSLGLPAGKRATCVFGQWTVPVITPVQGESGSLTVGYWVGIDGFGGDQVLQAGIATTTSGNSTSYWVWTEWFTNQFQDPPVKIDNFKISPGDVISFLVCAPQQDYGYISILNSTTNQSTSVGINARPGILSAGLTTEWIVEGVSADLPDFFDWVFTNAIASVEGNAFDLQPHGFTTEIKGNGGVPLTQSFIITQGAGIVFWKGGV